MATNAGDYWQLNFALLSQRWPQLAAVVAAQPLPAAEQIDATVLVDGIQLTSGYDPLAEAKIQASFLDDNATQAVLYGLGLGALPRLLLHRTTLQLLLVQVMNLALLRLQLTLADQRDWLADPRLTLFYDQKQQGLFHPFAVATGDLLLAEQSMWPLRDRVQQELNQNEVKQQHRADDPAMLQRLAANAQAGANDADIRELLQHKGRAWLCAAGPSLVQSLPLLQQQRQPGDWLVAVDAAVSYLLQQQVVPDLVVAIDAIASRLFSAADYAQLHQCALVYFPTVDPELVRQWPGPRYRAYGSSPFFDSLPQLDGLPPVHTATRLFCAGNVLHPAVDLCVQAGCAQLLMLGVDFGFNGTTTHAGRDMNLDYHCAPSESGHYLLNWRGEAIATWANFKGYLRDFEDYIAAHPQVDFYCLSADGAAIAGCRLWQGGADVA